MRKIIQILLPVTLVLALLIITCSGPQKKAGNKSALPYISDDSLLTLVEYQTFQYFWKGAEPVSGLARERYHVDGNYPENDMNVVTSGGSGFGLMAILTGVKRGFISREEAVQRFRKNIDFLAKADRFHGAWPHWMYGETGKVKPFSPKDDGADIVETAYLVQGLLAVRQFFNDGNDKEKKIAEDIDKLWKEVEWSWFTKGGEKVIYWHWSPDYGWKMNFPIRGYNECLIVYILAASSPTYPVSPDAYHEGWAGSGDIKTSSGVYGYSLKLRHNGAEKFGGPLFWAHYSFMGIDPRHLKDRYADYWQENVNQSLINWKWCIENPKHFVGYGENCWGLTASYSVNGYSAHAPGEDTDLGVITPTAAISSIVYTPEQSMKAIRHFYFNLGDKIWGEYGFYDAFGEQFNWYPKRYLAIDQGPEVVMIENHKSGFLWNLVMSCPEIKTGLEKLGFTTNN
ncbi:MAG: glucoamylase family protein [Bacteroidota bacterium]|nr:glucoamylase family protein [Bacteroidota bacterium]